MKSLVKIVGFDWIANQTLKKVVRLVFNAGLVVLAGTPAGASLVPVLGMFGITSTAGAQAAVTAALALAEAVRNEVKHDDVPTLK